MQIKYFLASLVIVLYSFGLNAQTDISGIVTEKSGVPIIGANVFIVGSYDGTTTDVDGSFSFNTTEEGIQVLSVSYLGYQSKELKTEVNEMKNLKITLRESANSLDAVEITASTFKAGDNSKVAVLKPLDMVTTAGSMGDVIAAIQSLPGTQQNPDDGRLFVRGGDARETKIFIDGMRVFSPYTRTFSGTPSRGRYSPFLFKGVSFSTGGYDAEFGQALSGVLDMNTIDEPKQTESNISLMSAGLGLSHTKKWDRSSLSFSGSYIDLTPYYWLMPTRLDFNTPYKGFSGELVHRYKTNKGLVKTYIAGDISRVGVNSENLDTAIYQEVDIDNRNLYINSTYSTTLSDRHSAKIGMSHGYNKDHLEVDEFLLDTDFDGYHFKGAFKTIINDFVVLNYGAEYFWQEDRLSKGTNDTNFFSSNIDRHLPTAFSSIDYFFSKDLALKLGARYEFNSLLNSNEINPRLTLAYKVGQNAQVSAAAGVYNQELDSEFLEDPSVQRNEKSSHFLLNYNYKTDKSIFRLEGYYKSYSDLVSYQRGFNFEPTQIANEGEGRAYGVDVFYRANNVVKYVDFWVSYSYLNNQRKYLDYPEFAAPSFSTNHNLSLIGKKWFPKLNSQLGVTYSLASGRPYDDPHTSDFMTERSGWFKNLSMSWAYLISQQKILFVSVSNVPRFKNEFGYRYSTMPDVNGQYRSEQIRPNDDQFFFVGFFVTISQDKTKNQLDQL